MCGFSLEDGGSTAVVVPRAPLGASDNRLPRGFKERRSMWEKLPSQIPEEPEGEYTPRRSRHGAQSLPSLQGGAEEDAAAGLDVRRKATFKGQQGLASVAAVGGAEEAEGAGRRGGRPQPRRPPRASSSRGSSSSSYSSYSSSGPAKTAQQMRKQWLESLTVMKEQIMQGGDALWEAAEIDSEQRKVDAMVVEYDRLHVQRARKEKALGELEAAYEAIDADEAPDSDPALVQRHKLEDKLDKIEYQIDWIKFQDENCKVITARLEATKDDHKGVLEDLRGQIAAAAEAIELKAREAAATDVARDKTVATLKEGILQMERARVARRYQLRQKGKETKFFSDAAMSKEEVQAQREAEEARRHRAMKNSAVRQRQTKSVIMTNKIALQASEEHLRKGFMKLAKWVQNAEASNASVHVPVEVYGHQPWALLGSLERLVKIGRDTEKDIEAREAVEEQHNQLLPTLKVEEMEMRLSRNKRYPAMVHTEGLKVGAAEREMQKRRATYFELARRLAAMASGVVHLANHISVFLPGCAVLEESPPPTPSGYRSFLVQAAALPAQEDAKGMRTIAESVNEAKGREVPPLPGLRRQNSQKEKGDGTERSEGEESSTSAGDWGKGKEERSWGGGRTPRGPAAEASPRGLPSKSKGVSKEMIADLEGELSKEADAASVPASLAQYEALPQQLGRLMKYVLMLHHVAAPQHGTTINLKESPLKLGRGMRQQIAGLLYDADGEIVDEDLDKNIDVGAHLDDAESDDSDDEAARKPSSSKAAAPGRRKADSKADSKEHGPDHNDGGQGKASKGHESPAHAPDSKKERLVHRRSSAVADALVAKGGRGAGSQAASPSPPPQSVLRSGRHSADADRMAAGHHVQHPPGRKAGNKKQTAESIMFAPKAVHESSKGKALKVSFESSRHKDGDAESRGRDSSKGESRKEEHSRESPSPVSTREQRKAQKRHTVAKRGGNEAAVSEEGKGKKLSILQQRAKMIEAAD